MRSIINLTGEPITHEQMDAGVYDFPTANQIKRLRAVLEDNHPSSSRKRLLRAADFLAEYACMEGETDDLIPTGALLPSSGNLVLHLAKELSVRALTPYQWVNNQLVEVVHGR